MLSFIWLENVQFEVFTLPFAYAIEIQLKRINQIKSILACANNEWAKSNQRSKFQIIIGHLIRAPICSIIWHILVAVQTFQSRYPVFILPKFTYRQICLLLCLIDPVHKLAQTWRACVLVLSPSGSTWIPSVVWWWAKFNLTTERLLSLTKPAIQYAVSWNYTN